MPATDGEIEGGQREKRYKTGGRWLPVTARRQTRQQTRHGTKQAEIMNAGKSACEEMVVGERRKNYLHITDVRDR